MNSVTTVVSFTAIALFSLASCSGGGVEGTGAGAPFEIETPRPDASPNFIDNPDLPCIGDVYDSPSEDQFQSALKPPSWMQGNWTGQRADGQIITIVATDNNVAFGTPDQQASIVDGFGKRIVVEIESTNQLFRFGVDDTDNNKPVSYFHEYTFIDENQIRYSISSDNYLDESVVMNSQSPTEVIRPPNWLLGEWRNEQCETRLFDVGNISIEYDNADPTISFAQILSGNDTTFQTLYKDDKIYEIEASYLLPDGTQRLRFIEFYELQEDGTVNHYTANRVQSLNRR